MNRNVDTELLFAYLNRELGEEDVLRVEAWYDESEENRGLLQQLYATLFLSDRVHAMNSIDVEQSLSEVKARISTPEPATQRKSLPIWKIAAAAVLTGLVFLGGFALNRMYTVMNQPFVIVTDLGERTQAILPDGSRVWVGACTKLEYYNPSIWRRERQVHLAGEAFFDVKKSRSDRFVVNSSQQKIEVLGTKFNVKANPDETFITTTLLEGSILLHAPSLPKEGIRMQPNQQFRLDIAAGQQDLTNCENSGDFISWIDGALHFERATLEEIARTLERYYNVEIVITKEALKQEQFTCDFETSENIYRIFSVLKMTNKFDYTVNNRRIELY